MGGSREGGGGGVQASPGKLLGYPSNAGPDPLENHKATKPAFNVRPSLACQRNADEMAFRWWADVGPPMVGFLSSLISSTKENKNKPLSKMVPL